MSYRDRIREKKLKLLEQASVIIKTETSPDVLRGIGGIDTDFYAGRINFQMAKDNGVRFSFIRAGQGFAVDSQFYYSWQAAKAAGVPRGWYWYLDTRYSIRGQAKILANEIKGDYGELPGVVDFEQDGRYKMKGYPKGKHLSASELYAFGVYLLEYLPDIRMQLLYGGYSYLLTWLPNPNMSKFAGLWFADPTRGRLEPIVPKNYPKPMFWQWSFAGNGHKYGSLEKGIDLDEFCGTEEEFANVIH